MSKRKGFVPRRRTEYIEAVDPMDSIATTPPRIEQLLTEILRLSPRCYGMMKHNARIQPAYRLSAHLKTLVDMMASKDSDDVLQDGLTDDERAVLTEIDGSGISLESRRTAHSLLNVETRSRVFGMLHRVYRDLKLRKNHVLEDRPLD